MHIVQDGLQLDYKFKCNICKQLLRDPVQSYCGHRFCSDCFVFIISCTTERIICPACQELDDDATSEFSYLTEKTKFPDNAMKREMYGLRVCCMYSVTGCKWIGVFKEFLDHIGNCRYIFCDNGYCVTNKLKHARDECPRKLIKCDCGKEIMQNHIQLHQSRFCPKSKRQCKECKERIEVSKFEQHLNPSGKCGKKYQLCQFGCEMVLKTELATHKERFAVAHLDMLRETLEFTLESRESNIDTNRVQSSEERINHLQATVYDLTLQLSKQPNKDIANSSPDRHGFLECRKDLDDLKSKGCIMDNKMSTLEGLLAVLSREIERAAGAVEHCERQRREDRQKLEVVNQKIMSLERIIALKDVAMAEQDLRIKSLELENFDGSLIWKISDFSKHRQNAATNRITSLYSPHFFSSRTGYKMCCRIYLNGDGIGKGTHISLFFVVMRGHFDALLQWPFRQKVTLMLIDQNGKSNLADAFQPDPTSSSFKQPTSEMNIASGCPTFASLSVVENPSNGYLKNDTIFIKVAVDISNL